MDGIGLPCIVLYHIVLHCVAIFCNVSYHDVLLKSSTIRWFGRVRMEISWARTLTSVASTTPYMATCKKSDIKQYSANTYTDTVQCKYKYKHSIVKIQIQLQYSGKWQEVWSSSYHALANSTRHSVSSKTKHIQSRFFLLQCLHKNTLRVLKVKVFHFDQKASIDFRPKIHHF